MTTIYLFQLFLPLALVLWVAVASSGSRLGFAVQFVASLLILTSLSRVGIWLLPPWWTPHTAAGLLVIVGAVRWRRCAPPAAWPSGTMAWAALMFFVALGGAAAVCGVRAWTGMRPPSQSVVALTWPLRAGTFLVANGGNDTLINAHLESLNSRDRRFLPWRGNAWAVDLVAIDGFGLRAAGLMPCAAAGPARRALGWGSAAHHVRRPLRRARRAHRAAMKGPVRNVIGFVMASGLAVAAVLTWWRFDSDMKLARARVAHGSVLIATTCGPIEYQQTGAGVPLLAVHGSGGGHDQGMAFAGALARQGIRVIAMSRFGYLRTPMPADASPAAQADAHACLLDALGIRKAAVLGGSAGALSALQMAIRHPDRVSALVLLVPLAYKPPTLGDSAPPLAPWVENIMMRLIGSDFLFWSALHVARDQVIKVVLATPPELLTTASAPERARVNAMLDNILPVSARAEGLRSDTAAGKTLAPAPLESIRAPTLIISARDDGYGTYASAQYTSGQIAGAKFIGFDEGGHTWVGHDDEVMSEILKLLAPPARLVRPAKP